MQAPTNRSLICIGALLSIAFGASLYYNLLYLFILPPFIAALYFAVFQTEKTFLALALLFPLSVNIEEYTKNIGLFIPTEPILFGLLLLLCATQIKSPFISRETWKEPIIYTWLILLAWIFITSVTSSNPLISFKFLVAKSWFVIPVLFFGTYFFKNEKNISRFFVLMTIGVSITALYTIVNHASYGFGEKESHWVMSPFFKDHTIYGAIIALSIPISIALLLVVKQKPLKQFLLLLMAVVLFLALYFSYTRAAWLSIALAVFIGFIIHIKLKKQIVIGVGIILLFFAAYKWQSIQFELSRNKQEHTTEDFSERLQSAGNVTTDASNLERINRWSCALEMFKERPVFGFGPGTYSFEYARFQTPNNLTIISTNFGDLGNAHSEYLSFLSEMGLLGLIFFISFVFSVFYSAIKLYYQTNRQERNKRIFIMAMIISLSSYFIHAFLNNFLDTDKAAIPVFAICAIIVSLKMKSDLSADPQRGIE